MRIDALPARFNIAKLWAPCAVSLLVAVCIVFGGASRENALQTSVLQMVAAFYLLWLLSDDTLEPAPKSARPVFWMFGALFVWTGLQVIPLPPELWTIIPGRTEIAAGFALLGDPLPWLPLSLAPEQTLAAILQFLPPLAIFTAAVKLRWRHAIALSQWVLPAFAVVSVILGIFQIADGADSPFYFYPTTNDKSPTGFFANANHQASFLIMCLPFAAALIGHLRSKRFSGDGEVEKAVLAVIAWIIIIIGALVAGSIGGYILLGPVLLASFFIALGGGKNKGSGKFALGALIGVGLTAAAMASSPYVMNASTNFESGVMGRHELWNRTSAAIQEQLPAGAGLGAFQELYPLYENPDAVGMQFANHAHNDYLEIVLELGAPGIVLIGCFIFWWGRRALQIWSESPSPETRLRKAASVAIGVLLLHSLADYPGRTLAVGAVIGLCLAIMVAERRRPEAVGAAGGGHLVL